MITIKLEPVKGYHMLKPFDGWGATVTPFPGLMALGKTKEEAINECKIQAIKMVGHYLANKELLADWLTGIPIQEMVDSWFTIEE